MRTSTITFDGKQAAATIAFALSDLPAIYPITPATPMADQADSWSASGKPNLWGSVPTVIDGSPKPGRRAHCPSIADRDGRRGRSASLAIASR